MRNRRSAGKAFWALAALALGGLVLLWWRAVEPGRNKPDQIHRPLPATPAAKPVLVGTNSASLPAPPLPLTNPTPAASLPSKSAPAFEPGPPALARTNPADYPRPVQNVFEMQVALARQGISSGSLDGFVGPQTRAALKSFQQKEHLAISGELDNATRERLVLEEPPLTSYLIVSNDLARLQPLSPTWLGKSQQTALEYETVLELLAEKAQANPGLVRRLNPGLDWSNVFAGTTVELPNVIFPAPTERAAFLTIRLADKILEAWDESTNLLAHFPCSIARRVEKRPVGELHVAVIAPHPNYTLDPEIFPESAEARELKTKLVLPPGPNNPVGIAWIGLDKPGYGIHGTPNPEQVGRTESHGCFRLANWNAEYLVRLVTVGTPVLVEP